LTGSAASRATALTPVAAPRRLSCASVVTPIRSSRCASSGARPSASSGVERAADIEIVFSSIIGLVTVVKSSVMTLAPVSFAPAERSRTWPCPSISTNTLSSRCSSLSA
jgi:hypothetical protein